MFCVCCLKPMISRCERSIISIPQVTLAESKFMFLRNGTHTQTNFVIAKFQFGRVNVLKIGVCCTFAANFEQEIHLFILLTLIMTFLVNPALS